MEKEEIIKEGETLANIIWRFTKNRTSSFWEALQILGAATYLFVKYCADGNQAEIAEVLGKYTGALDALRADMERREKERKEMN